MKALYYILLFFLTISCASPYELLEKGKYDNARSVALRQLNKNKNSQENRQILIAAMDRKLEIERIKIYRAAESNSVQDWERAYEDSRAIAEYIVQVEHYVGDRYDETLENMDEIHEDMRKKLFENYFTHANNDLNQARNTGNKASAQSAYHLYLEAGKYAPPSHDLSNELNESLNRGIVNISITAGSFFDLDINWMIQRSFSGIEQHSTLFERIQYNGFSENNDVLIAIEIDPSESCLPDKVETLDFSKEILVRTDRLKDTSGQYIDVPIYETVYGSVEVITVARNYELRARSMVTDQYDLLNFSSHYFSEEQTVAQEFCRIFGDTRAIPLDYKTRNTKVRFDEDEIYGDLVNRIYRSICNYYF